MAAAATAPCVLSTCPKQAKMPVRYARPVCCKAVNDVAAVSKRGTLMGLGMAAVLAVDLIKPTASWALLPDDDDVDLVQKAKASRQRKLQEELATERKYTSDAGFSSKNKQKILVPLQKAVFELARAGSLLEADNLSGVASNVSGSWVDEFKSASGQISSGLSDAEKSVSSVYLGINALATSAQQGDVVGSKKAYVATIAAFQNWASAVGVAGSLKGL